MKVAYVLLTSLGGIPHYTAELANAVAEHSEVVVFKPRDSNDQLFSENVKLMNVFDTIYFRRDRPLEAANVKNLKSILSYSKMKMIDDMRPDVIHFTDHYPQSLFAFLYGLDRRYPTVSTLHAAYDSIVVRPAQTGTRSYINAALYTFVEVITGLIRSDMLIVHTAGNKRTLLRNGVDEKKIAVIPHGAYTFFNDFANPQSGTARERNCILFFGHIVDAKGIKILIEAMPRIIEAIPDVKLVIAGQGDLSPYAEDLESLKPNVEVYNKFIPNEMVAELFGRANIIILPYLYSPGPSGVLATALAFKKPAIVTDVGDLPNIVENGSEGLVIPPSNPGALADAAITLLRNEAMMKTMSEKAHEKAQKLSWHNVARLHLDVYQASIKNRQLNN